MGSGHGGNVEEIARKYNIDEKSIIDFSANINPLGLSNSVKEEIIKAIDKVERYPDITYFNLKKAISKYENVKEDSIILGNGAAEVIFNICRGIKPKKACLIAPSFIEYEDALKSVNSEIDYYILQEDFIIKEDFLNSINNDLDIIFICNPNNPTGVLTSKDFLIKVLEKAVKTNTTIVIDESFLDFVENKNDFTTINIVDKFKNLIVVKSLTKFFAFPGIRIGYAITANKEYIKAINKVAVSWNVNTLANFGAIKALSEKQYISDTILYVKKENEYLYNSLKEFEDIILYKGEVNFMFFKCLKNIDLKKELIKKGILIRECNNYKGLDKGYYRVAVRKRHENEMLIKALKEVLQ